MWAERKVSQLTTSEEQPGLATGHAQLQEISKKGLTQRVKVWEFMLDPDLYLVAYNKIRGDSGALTKGTDNENIDGFSRQKNRKDHWKY